MIYKNIIFSLKRHVNYYTGQNKKENDSQIGTNSLRERKAIARVCVARVRHLDTRPHGVLYPSLTNLHVAVSHE